MKVLIGVVAVLCWTPERASGFGIDRNQVSGGRTSETYHRTRTSHNGMRSTWSSSFVTFMSRKNQEFGAQKHVGRTRSASVSSETSLRSLSKEALLSKSEGGAGGSLLEDSTGRINRVLAERIFDWEQELRRDQNLPKVEYSIRSGLRLVEQLVQELLEQRGDSNNLNHHKHHVQHYQKDDTLYSDLVQEGLAALLDAMKHYREEDHKHDDDSDKDGFSSYARKEIQKQLEQSLSFNLVNRPMRLPQSVLTVVHKAKALAQQMAAAASREDSSSKPRNHRPTVNQVAQRLDVPPEQLRDYLNLYKRSRPPPLSMESTVEITHPLLDETVQFTDQDEWEKQQQQSMTTQSGSSDTGTRSGTQNERRRTDSIRADSVSANHDDEDNQTEQWISEYYLDHLLEGDDQAWIVQQEQYAGSLPDMIPDTEEPSPDDQVLSDMIRSDVYEFLASTLSKQEHDVIRAVFGLDTGKQASLKRTAEKLGMDSSEQVSVLLAGGMQKLRESYTKRFVEPYLESVESPSKRIIDSV